MTAKLFVEAVSAGDLDAVRRMLQSEPDFAVARTTHDKTALHWAAEKSNTAMVQVLLDAGCDPQAQTDWGATPLEWATNSANVEVAELLLAHTKQAPNLWVAAGLGKLEQVQDFWRNGPPDASAGRTPRVGTAAKSWPADSALMTGDFVSDAFYIACRNGNTSVAAYLLTKGARVDAKGYFGGTGLHWAAQNGHHETVSLLLDHGADMNIRDEKFLATPVGWASEGGQGEIVALLLQRGAEVDVTEAANLGNLERVQSIIRKDPSRLDWRGVWGTALHEAAFFGHRDIFEWLLEQGADTSLVTTDGQTALRIAQKCQQAEILALLKQKGVVV